MSEPRNEDWEALDDYPLASAQILLMYAPKTVGAIYGYISDQLTGDIASVGLDQVDLGREASSSGHDVLRPVRHSGEVPDAEEPSASRGGDDEPPAA